MSTIDDWQPKTRLGRMVKEGKINSINEIFQLNMPIKEVEIIDALVPNLEEEVIDINLVQKQTDAGEQSRFKSTVVIGNNDGLVGIGEGKAKEIGPAIRAAIMDAKMKIMPVRRGCGSWECSGGEPHSILFKATGKSGSVKVELLPAPKGTGLVVADYGKIVLRLSGISDIWSRSSGHTRTTFNFAKAIYNALKNTYKIMIPNDWERV